MSVALRAGGLDGIVTTLAELVSRPVLVEDARGTVLAQTGPLTELPGADVRAAPGAAAGAVGEAEHIGAVAPSIRRAMASVPGAEGATVAVSGTEQQTFRQAYRTAREHSMWRCARNVVTLS
ncbi:hypothetical protein ACIQZB_25785 [Streptomyces sp. NPDC097727]|uniref:hypothetical protein n=1 Tax=Streptomyces sp. NPDC097727 TaxID=3366092 RepID=UPI0038234C1C